MRWGLLALGIVASALLMILLATKWKLPKRYARLGAILVAFLAALPFSWLYAQVDSGWALAAILVGQLAFALATGLCLVLARFWRDPERTPPKGKGLVISPADGTIGYVTSVDAGSTPLVSKNGRDYYLGELTGANPPATDAYVIGVEMSFVDVHVNRCPIGGKVTLLKHIEGQFMSLGRAESPFVNARCTTVIENHSLTLAVVQVASRLVRRVESYLSPGAAVDLGQRLGIIRFGSLVAVVLPQREDVRIEVRPGDPVKAGMSILARYQEDATRGQE